MQGFAALPKCGVDETEHGFAVHHGTVGIVGGRRVPALVSFEQHQRGIHIRRRPEHIASDNAHAFRGAVPCELHAWSAVDL